MRPRSVTGPLVLILIGAFFLWYNLRPDVPVWQWISIYWPYILIAWGGLRLVEVCLNAIAGRPLPRGFSGGEIVLVVFLCVIGSVAFTVHHHGWRVGPGRLDIFGEQFDYPVNSQIAAGSAGRVIFQNMRGGLRVQGSDRPEIRVVGQKSIRAFRKTDADQADRETAIEVFPEGDHIVVRGNTDRISGDRRVTMDLQVEVPKSFAVEAHSRGGDIEVNDVTGDVDVSSERSDVRLSQIGGNGRIELRHSDLIRASDVKGNLDLQGRGSNVQLENVAGQVTINGQYSGTLDFRNLAKPLHFESPNTDLLVKALPGQMTMDLGDLTVRNAVGPIRFRTRSKDIRIENFSDALEIESDRGDIAIQPGRVPLGKIDVHSRTGKIELELPQKAMFELMATTDHGEAMNDYGAPIRQTRDGQSGTLKGSVGNGPMISINTQRGTVLVRKAGENLTGSGAEAKKSDQPAPSVEKF